MSEENSKEILSTILQIFSFFDEIESWKLIVSTAITVHLLHQAFYFLQSVSSTFQVVCSLLSNWFVRCCYQGLQKGLLSNCCQFHQHFIGNFFTNLLFVKHNFKLRKTVCTKKLIVKCWWNWHILSHRLFPSTN